MTIRQMNDFVRQRLDPVLQLPYYRAIIDPNMNSINAKRIRNSNMSFRTSSKPGSVEGLNVDMVSIDEFDRANIQAIQSAENSMSSSKFKVSRKWSTPTAPNVGIHDLFVHSDQMEYIHKCQHCGYWNLLNYADYVDDGDPHSGGNIRLLNPAGINLAARAVIPGTYQFVCAKCGKPLDRWYNGTWAARYPSRTQDTNGTRGYHISQMNAVWITADALKTAELNAKSKQAFYNYNLGMPYQDTKLQVSDADVKDHATFPKRRLNRDGYQLVAVGIDWG